MENDVGKSLNDLLAEPEQGYSFKKNKTRAASQPFDVKTASAKETIRKRSIKNNNLESDQRMKRISLIALFILLTLETITIFTLSFLQGFGQNINFELEEWNFRLVITGTLTQITIMLKIAIEHLFPPQK